LSFLGGIAPHARGGDRPGGRWMGSVVARVATGGEAREKRRGKGGVMVAAGTLAARAAPPRWRPTRPPRPWACPWTPPGWTSRPPRARPRPTRCSPPRWAPISTPRARGACQTMCRWDLVGGWDWRGAGEPGRGPHALERGRRPVPSCPLQSWHNRVLPGRRVLQVDEVLNAAAPAKQRWGRWGGRGVRSSAARAPRQPAPPPPPRQVHRLQPAPAQIAADRR